MNRRRLLILEKFWMIWVLLLGATGSAFGHGEGQAGMHGGVIRMPGAFHTELKQTSQRSFDLYLLDMQWRNPSVAQSTVSAILNVGSPEEKVLECSVRKTFFACTLPGKADFKAGDAVTIRASREGANGIPVSYPFPFVVGGAHGS